MRLLAGDPLLDGLAVRVVHAKRRAGQLVPARHRLLGDHGAGQVVVRERAQVHGHAVAVDPRLDGAEELLALVGPAGELLELVGVVGQRPPGVVGPRRPVRPRLQPSWTCPLCRNVCTTFFLPFSNQIVHFHGLSSTWCASITPLTKIDRISRVRVELK